MTIVPDHSASGSGSTCSPHPYESPAMLAATGPTLRPGGFTLTERALGLCAFKPGDYVIDVGCGMGATVALMTQRYHLLAIGVDRSRVLVARGLECFGEVPLLIADAAELPFPDGRADGVFMECVLSAGGAPERILAEAYRVLRNGGHLVVTDMYLRETTRMGHAGEAGRQAATDRGAGRPPDDIPAGSCVAGAIPRSEVEARLSRAGFRILIWEDHTTLLKTLAAEIILRCGSLSEFWAQACGTRGDQIPGPPNPLYRRLGYYLAVAIRE